MKKITIALLLALVLSALTACGLPQAPVASLPTETTQDTQPETSQVTTVPETTAEETTVPETTADTTPVTQPSLGAVPYLFTVEQAGYPIYDGPGYDCKLVSAVDLPGVYTIVEEAWDAGGDLWGRLKSGVGWINLTDNGNAETLVSCVLADYASEYMLSHASYLEFTASEAEYAVAVAFRAEGTVTDFNLLSVSLDDSGYHIDGSVYTLDALTPDQPLVAWLDFPGDMSAWAISYVDSTGARQYRLLTMSLKDGSLEVNNFYP